MRIYLSGATILMAGIFSGSILSKAQTALPLPGCETSPEVRQVIDDQLDYKVLDGMKYPERLAYERKVLEDLIAKYPRELEPYEKLRDIVRQFAPDDYPALRDGWVKRAKDNPDDPLALLLAGEALWGTDTPEAIRLFEAARTKAPNFPWPDRELAWLYSDGKRADPVKAKENIGAFYGMCPAGTDAYAWFLVAKYPALKAKVTAAVAPVRRARLEKETDPKRLEGFENVWGPEFRIRGPKEFDAQRAQVAQDLKRLEALNPHGDAEWRAFLIRGYKQSGASKESLTAMEDSLIREFPHSTEADDIVTGRWNDAHKEPSGQNDTAAWAKYNKESEEAMKGWIRDYPDDRYLQRFAWFEAIRDDDTISEKDALAAIDAYVQSVRDYKEPGFYYIYFPIVADYLLKHGWEPGRALELLKESQSPIEQYREQLFSNDNQSDEDVKKTHDWQIQMDQHTHSLMLKAAMEAGKPEEALKLRADLEAPPLADKKLLSEYWWNRARFESIQNHAQDSLTYYQLALQSRVEAPKAYHGRLRDDLTAEARTLWTAQGGTEAAWAVWSKPPASATEQLAEGRWEKPTKAISAFELSDFSGKTWRLKELDGKMLLINVWATWCGPCRLELPHLEKFYEKVKDRSDIQVLTFDIDSNPGLVVPFLKDKGFTFPVLSASSIDFEYGGVPQNWIVDSHGVLRWVQVGYEAGSDADFEKEMLERIDAVKGGQ